jgi:hypothetical protein
MWRSEIMWRRPHLALVTLSSCWLPRPLEHMACVTLRHLDHVTCHVILSSWVTLKYLLRYLEHAPCVTLSSCWHHPPHQGVRQGILALRTRSLAGRTRALN